MTTAAPEEQSGSLRRPRLHGMTMAQIIDELCSSSAALGCGTASCIVLALAAGCAAKTISLTDGSSPQASVTLQATKERLEHIANGALEAGDEESRRFQDSLHSAQAEDQLRLAKLERELARLADELAEVIDELTPLVAEKTRGDLLAAAWLHSSAASIVRQNRCETEDRLQSEPQPRT